MVITTEGNINYAIHTSCAARLKKEILDSVEAKADGKGKGKGIVTWQVTEADAIEKFWCILMTNGLRILHRIRTRVWR